MLYTLSFVLPGPKRIRVGRLGAFTFPAGRYLYTGSARRAALARIARHIRKLKPLYWHIDYFRRHAILEAVRLYPAPRESECGLNRKILRRPGARVPAPGFGSSDCRCPSHLVLIPRKVARRSPTRGARGSSKRRKVTSRVEEATTA